MSDYAAADDDPFRFGETIEEVDLEKLELGGTVLDLIEALGDSLTLWNTPQPNANPDPPPDADEAEEDHTAEA